jgi:hypothetical protein
MKDLLSRHEAQRVRMLACKRSRGALARTDVAMTVPTAAAAMPATFASLPPSLPVASE